MIARKHYEFATDPLKEVEEQFHQTITRNILRFKVDVGAGEVFTIYHSSDRTNTRTVVVDDLAFINKLVGTDYTVAKTEDSTAITFIGAGVFGVSLEV